MLGLLAVAVAAACPAAPACMATPDNKTATAIIRGARRDELASMRQAAVCKLNSKRLFIVIQAREVQMTQLSAIPG
ncbi:hypothetical protein GCM10011396_17730 [Undibacterium terreum]|uniref:Uncharacterized protein n=1 Tax=Undibacterium terreum TaxID=1224302 RepID=A0A916XGY2_9BURK|nr:hypothetical protein GCM10011396_17730 [Undibacterium terreum]